MPMVHLTIIFVNDDVPDTQCFSELLMCIAQRIAVFHIGSKLGLFLHSVYVNKNQNSVRKQVHHPASYSHRTQNKIRICGNYLFLMTHKV